MWLKVSLCHSGCSAVARLWLTAAATSWVQQSTHLSLQSSWNYRFTPPCLETIFHGCPGWSLTLGLSDPSTLALQSAGMTGVSYCAWLQRLFQWDNQSYTNTVDLKLLGPSDPTHLASQSAALQ
ncbi:hypothetical protein AAY473_039422, partial [Plecturocebus cupreus]